MLWKLMAMLYVVDDVVRTKNMMDGGIYLCLIIKKIYKKYSAFHIA